jgi:hypothetical protein
MGLLFFVVSVSASGFNGHLRARRKSIYSSCMPAQVGRRLLVIRWQQAHSRWLARVTLPITHRSWLKLGALAVLLASCARPQAAPQIGEISSCEQPTQLAESSVAVDCRSVSIGGSPRVYWIRAHSQGGVELDLQTLAITRALTAPDVSPADMFRERGTRYYHSYMLSLRLAMISKACGGTPAVFSVQEQGRNDVVIMDSTLLTCGA